MRKALLAPLLGALLLANIGIHAGADAHPALADSHGGILYSWSMAALAHDERDALLTWLEQLDIGTLYQGLTDDFFRAGDDAFLADMSAAGVEVLHLCGTPEWSDDAERMMAEIDQVVDFNSAAGTPIAGIVFDVEPHVPEDYREPEDYMEYARTLQAVYAYAQQKGLYMVAVIPYWLERLDTALLEDIIKTGCDEVSVMNYYTDKTTEHLAEEVGISRDADKPLNTIYELDYASEASSDSLKAIHADFESLSATYAYRRLRIAYHHLGDLM